MPDRTVNPRYLPIVVQVPINTPASAPVTVTVAAPSTVLESVHLIIPSGHAGLTGFQVRTASTTILPYGAATDWITGNDATLDFDMGDLEADPIVLRGYNTDSVYTHTFYGQLKIRDVAAPAAATVAPNVVPIFPARVA